MNDEQKLALIQRKTKQRLGFSAVVLLLYFSFVLNWTSFGSFLAKPLAGSPVSGSLLMFAALIVIFIALELVFLALQRRSDSSQRGDI